MLGGSVRCLQFIILSCLMTLSIVAQAGRSQHVQVCLMVDGNTSSEKFQTSFASTDFFDTPHKTTSVTNGQTCVNHTYHHGPKNIRLRVGAVSKRGRVREVLLMPTSSCAYLHMVANADHEYSGLLQSDALKTRHADEVWTFTLSEAPPINGYEYVYDVSCTH